MFDWLPDFTTLMLVASGLIYLIIFVCVMIATEKMLSDYTRAPVPFGLLFLIGFVLFLYPLGLLLLAVLHLSKACRKRKEGPH